jgi:predicted permease
MSPIVWLPVTGMILSFCHVSLPAPILASVDQTAKAAGGVPPFALRNKTYTAEATSTMLFSTVLGLVTEAILITFLRP